MNPRSRKSSVYFAPNFCTRKAQSDQWPDSGAFFLTALSLVFCFRLFPTKERGAGAGYTA
jgi:hypothetical protein